MTRFFLFALSFLAVVVGSQAANITWDPEKGYQSDEVELSGLLPEEVQKVLDWMNQGRKAEENGNLRTALKKYKRVQKKFPKSQYAPEAVLRTANIQMGRNKIDQAFESYYLLAFVYPNYGSFNATVGEMYKIAVARLETYRDKIFWVFPGFLNRDRAIKYFERIIYIAPYSDYAPLSLMNIAGAHAKKKSEALTIFALDRLITNYPKSFLTPDAYIQLAETHADLVRGPYYDQGNTEDAITYFEDFLIQFPENKNVNLAEDGLADSKNIMALSKLKIADYYFHKRSNYHAAKVLYNEAITIAPKSKSADFARGKLTQIASIEAKKDEVELAEAEREEPSLEDMEQKARKRAKRKVLGIF